MRQENSYGGSRRRRGGRRHSRSRSASSATGARSTEKAKKPGILKRIVGILTGKRKSAASRAAGSMPASRASRAVSEPRPPRKPELLEVTSPKLYVGNLSFDALESDLFELFAGVGSVQNAEIVSHRETQKSKGFAFVTMGSVEEAKRAVAELHDKEFMGRKLLISGAKTSDVRE